MSEDLAADRRDGIFSVTALDSLDILRKSSGIYARRLLLHVMNVLKFRQEPLVDVSRLPDLVDTVALVESGCNGEYALVRRVDQLLVNIFHNCKVVLMKRVVQLY
jgi:hypothetical protein